MGSRERRPPIFIHKNHTEMQVWSLEHKRAGKSIGLVPTMGFLHQGHLSLIDMASRHADLVVVSIFVNPTQFGPNEDFDAYPRNMERDLAFCRERGVAAVFTPGPATMYGPNYQTYVSLEKLPDHLCGLSRPGHFRGVATVVSKLFNIVLPEVAVFGEKDFQQLAVLRQMVADLNFPIKILGGPIVREEDGLAMSSRNVYLSADERKSALSLSKSLQNAAKSVAAGERSAEKIIKEAEKKILGEAHTEIDYIRLCDPVTLDDITLLSGPTLMALAVKVGKTRLIDNAVLVF